MQASTQIILAVISSFLAVTFLSTANIVYLFIVLGQGHFFATYIYQGMGGKIAQKYIFSFILASSFLFLVVSHHSSLQLITLVAASFFVPHFLYDILFIGRVTERRTYFSVAIFAITLCFGALLYEDLYRALLPVSWFFIAGLMGIVSLYMAIQGEKQNPALKTHAFAYMLLCVGLIAIKASSLSITSEQLFGAVILFHYAHWYLHIGNKLYGEKKAFLRYLIIIGSTNILLFVLFLAYRNGMISALSILFQPMYFYIWTLLHIIFSIRWFFKSPVLPKQAITVG